VTGRLYLIGSWRRGCHHRCTLPIAVGAEEMYSGIGEKRGSIYDEAGGRIDDNITRAGEFYIR